MPFRLLRAERTMAKDTPVAMRNRSGKLRKLAEEAKALATRMQDAVSKETMLEIAERYEVLARYADQRAKVFGLEKKSRIGKGSCASRSIFRAN
jgi:hypothetical protein